MKKTILLGLLLAIVSIVATGCSSCQSENKKQENVPDVKVLALTPETCISNDRQAIFLRTPKDYTLLWMQTEITLTSFLTDAAIQDATVMEVTNGFQTLHEMEIEGHKAIDTKVTLITTNTMATDSLVMQTFYLDNKPLNDKQITLTFKDAIGKALQANCPKPQTRICVLRCPVGPVGVEDAYYMFGNEDLDTPMIFVNARTGDVTTENPAFTKPSEDEQ